MRHFSEEEKRRVVNLYFDEKLTTQEVVNQLGYPTRQNLERWLKKDARYGENIRHGFYPIDLKIKAIEMYRSGQYTIEEIATELKLPSPKTIFSWVYKARDEGYAGLVSKKKCANMPKQKKPKIPDEITELRKRCEELELDNAILQETIEVLKKDPGANLKDLSHREKSQVIGALKMKQKSPLQLLLTKMNLSPSSYYYHQRRLKQPDSLYDIRVRVKQLFEKNRGVYGYRRIWCCLKKEGLRVSEKIVRRLMSEQSLQVKTRRLKKYSSYQGEISPAPENLLQRDFHAERPNEKWLTDITELAAADGKVYLSPIIDCFDGFVVAWKTSFNPNAELTNSMLEEAVSRLKDGEKPILHSDRGVHYRWDSWIQIMERWGLTRSMSRKASSPDNAACEGFFGRLKNEMYYGRHWKQRSKEELIQTLNDYIEWYNKKRIKVSLGGRSPYEYRAMLGYTL